MDTPHDQSRSAAKAAPRRAADGGSPLRVYKPSQGTAVRWGTVGGSGLVAISAAWFTHAQLAGTGELVQTLVPVGVLLALAVVTFYLVGRNRTLVEFMIATEGEMKKVNWSSRREVIGATKVVITSVLALGFLLFVVDVIFMLFFSAINVLRVPILPSIFGQATGAE